MGFTVNKKINIELTHEEAIIINVALSIYQMEYKDTADSDILKKMKIISSKIGRELFNHPDNDLPNGH